MTHVCPFCGQDKDRRPRAPMLTLKIPPKSLLARILGRHGVVNVFCPWSHR